MGVYWYRERKSVMITRMHNDDFELLDPPGGQRVRLRFDGRFEGEGVTWEATVVTLAQLHTESGEAQSRLRNFLQIGEMGAQGRKITIGLGVAAIDRPALRKTVMMVRQYKRLRPGRHEYGEEQLYR